MSNAVSLKRIAVEAQSSRPLLHRLATETGLPVIHYRASNGKDTQGIHVDNVPALLDALHALRGGEGSRSSESLTLGSLVYVIKLDPVHRAGRVKVGTTDVVGQRLQAFRTTCPEAVEHWSMPAPRACEGYALALAQVMGTRVESKSLTLRTMH